MPALLRRVAESITELGAVDLMDTTYSTEITAEGPWPSCRIYYTRKDPADS